MLPRRLTLCRPSKADRRGRRSCAAAVAARWIALALVAAVLTGAAPAGAVADPAAVEASPRSGRFEGSPVRPGGAPDGRTEKDPAQPADAAPTTQSAAVAAQRGPGAPGGVPAIRFNWPRVILSLASVIGLILLLRFGLRRWIGAVGIAGAGQGVRVVGRTVLGPKQQVVLLQVGRRVIVAADNGGQLSSLAQITDPDEIAALLGQVGTSTATAAPALAAPAFGKWFGRARDDFDADAPAAQGVAAAGVTAPAGDAPVDAARGELAGLMDKVRGLAQQFQRR